MRQRKYCGTIEDAGYAECNGWTVLISGGFASFGKHDAFWLRCRIGKVSFRRQSQPHSSTNVVEQPLMSLMQNHQVNVLVVDPDVESREQIQEVLLADGYSCRVVSTAMAAIQAAREKTPNLLICDMNLGDESGLELFATLKSSIDCPVVFLSDSRKPETVKHARSAGATFFLSKPLDPDVLTEIVDKALWMPHLVRRHVDSAAHQLKPPTFVPSASRGGSHLTEF
jgi:CheY-like chemotaxis protein